VGTGYTLGIDIGVVATRAKAAAAAGGGGGKEKARQW
jgi:hypothetical protein